MKNESEKCKFCDSIHKGKHCSYYNEGINREIAFIFSCPGNKEKKNNFPISGATGEAFSLLLKKMKEKELIKEPYNCRYDFRITNATTNIESKSETNRTEAKNSDVIKTKNKQRLLIEIKDFETIICFGKKAKHIVSQLPTLKDKKILYVRHLSPTAYINLKINNKTHEGRAQYVFDEVIEQYKS